MEYIVIVLIALILTTGAQETRQNADLHAQISLLEGKLSHFYCRCYVFIFYKIIIYEGNRL